MKLSRKAGEFWVVQKKRNKSLGKICITGETEQKQDLSIYIYICIYAHIR